MENKQNIIEQLRTKFDEANTPIGSRCYGFYDWFCKDQVIEHKSLVLQAKLKQLIFSPKFDPVATYTFFKNNCPMHGSLYDDFRICDLETSDVLFTISMARPDANKKYEVWGRDNDFNGALIEGSWAEIKQFFEV